MFGMSLTEILVILLVTLVVLGPERLPDLARTLGKWVREIRRASNTFRDAFMLEEDSGSYSEQEERFRKLLDTEESSDPSQSSGPIDVPGDESGPPGSVSRPDPSPMPTPEVRPVALQDPRSRADGADALRHVELPRVDSTDALRRIDIESAPILPW